MIDVRGKLGTLWRDHKGWVLGVAGFVLALLLGYGFGRYAQPAKVVTEVKTVVQTQTKVEYKDRVVEKKVYVQVEKKREHVETTTEKKPDGTTVIKVVKDTSTDRDETTTADRTKDSAKVATADSKTTIDDKKVVVMAKPRLRLGVTLGMSIPYVLGDVGDVGVPGLRGAVIGAEFDVRVAGPIFLGVRGNTQGVLSLGLSGEF